MSTFWDTDQMLRRLNAIRTYFILGGEFHAPAFMRQIWGGEKTPRVKRIGAERRFIDEGIRRLRQH